MPKPFPTPEEIKAMSTPDLVKKMNELLAELEARTFGRPTDPKTAAPDIPKRKEG